MNFDMSKIQDIQQFKSLMIYKQKEDDVEEIKVEKTFQLSICKYDDMELIYNKEDMYFNASNLYNKYSNGRKIQNFFKKNDVQTALMHGANMSVMHYKINYGNVKYELRQYTGIFVHQDLFQIFILWVRPQKFIEYSRLLNQVLMNITLKNMTPNEKIDEIKNENEQLSQIVIQQENKIQDQQEQIFQKDVQLFNSKQKQSQDQIENIYIYEQNDGTIYVNCLRKTLNDREPFLINNPNSKALLTKFRQLHRNNIKYNTVINMQLQEVQQEFMNIVNEFQ